MQKLLRYFRPQLNRHSVYLWNACTAILTARAESIYRLSGTELVLLVRRADDDTDEFAGGKCRQIAGCRDVLVGGYHHECHDE